MDNPRLVHGNVIPMGIPWETSHRMGVGRDRRKLLWDGNGTDKYVPWTTIGGSRGAKGAEYPPRFFQIRFLIGGPRHRNANWGAFLYSL